jgi:hypothetical protein
MVQPLPDDNRDPRSDAPLRDEIRPVRAAPRPVRSAGATAPPSPGGFESPDPHSTKVDSKPAPESGPDRGGRPRALDERQKGQLTILLAVGLSQREAAAWLECSQTTIWRVLSSDAELANDVKRFHRLARLQPLLRVYRASGESWRAATWLLTYLDKRCEDIQNGESLTQDMTRLAVQIRHSLYPADPRADNELGLPLFVTDPEKR